MLKILKFIKIVFHRRYFYYVEGVGADGTRKWINGVMVLVFWDTRLVYNLVHEEAIESGLVEDSIIIKSIGRI